MNTDSDVIRKECAVKAFNSVVKGNNNMHTSDIMHKYEFGERNKDKSNKYSLFTRARMNRQ